MIQIEKATPNGSFDKCEVSEKLIHRGNMPRICRYYELNEGQERVAGWRRSAPPLRGELKE